ncbi:MAG TPA: TIGR03557 family F420-dependent LLM class oxidoreductase [Candidatus Sulfotelmatobacter sp.]|nr:TIGR03557 family F420-dependent LLM class oxidoreductase [Candidatus Sulfotelmatobacter sp.]
MAKIFYYLGHEQFQPEELVEHAILAEKSGFDGLFVSEHFNPWVADVGAAGFAFSTLGAIAQATKKIELMTGVTTPLFRYHPAIVAQAAATIDRLSGGRFTLGVGNGESINETPFGFKFPDYGERSERMVEALEIMHRLLGREKINFSGKYYKLHSSKLYSPPLNKVEIYLAAGGPKSAVLASQEADGIIVSVKDPKKTLEEIVIPAKNEAKKLGKKSFKIVASKWTVFAKSKEDAYAALKAWRGLRAPSRDKATDPQLLQNEADKLSKEEILARYTIVKSPQDYIEQYKPLIKDLGADIIAIQTTGENQKNIIEDLGKNVLPDLRKI